MKATIELTRIELPFLIDALRLYLDAGHLNQNHRRSIYATELLKRLETVKQREFPDQQYTGGGYTANQRIRLLEEVNPKQVGSDSAARYDRFRDKMTVSEALAAGVSRGDLRWDHAHGFIDIV